jgi:hypothetical protein
MGEFKPKPGWLMKELEDIPSSLAFAWAPQTLWQFGGTLSAPLGPFDAYALRRKMQERYREWTGKELEFELREDRTELGRNAAAQRGMQEVGG